MNTQLLKKRFEETPRMEPQDAAKLAYQSAYGCGHLLPSKEICMEMFEREVQNTPVSDVPVFTPIGNGLCRMNLASPVVHGLNPEWIWRMMSKTDVKVRNCEGLTVRCWDVLNGLMELARAGKTAFSAEEFDAYMKEFIRAGEPVVSHTENYRKLYHPAYRVVLQDYALLAPVLAGIDKGCSLVVIDGPCGSGKTTLAERLAELLSTSPVPMDDFFLPPKMRTPERLSEPGGNVHYERFAQEVLGSLLSGGKIHWKRFDCSNPNVMVHCFENRAKVNIIEGSYSHHPAFREAYEQLGALRVFVEVDEDEQLRRIKKRDPYTVHMFESRWIPLEKNYFQAYDIRGGADVIIQNPAWGEERA